MAFGWSAAISEVSRIFHFELVRMALFMAGALLIVVAIGLCIASLLIALSTQMPDHLAALLVAGGLFLIGTVIIAITLRHKSPKPTEAPKTDATETDPQFISDQLLEAALTQVARTPLTALLAAAALGTITGLLRPKETP